ELCRLRDVLTKHEFILGLLVEGEVLHCADGRPAIRRMLRIGNSDLANRWIKKRLYSDFLNIHRGGFRYPHDDPSDGINKYAVRLCESFLLQILGIRNVR